MRLLLSLFILLLSHHTFAQSGPGSSIRLDGLDEFLLSSITPALEVNAGSSLTITLWFRTNSRTGNPVLLAKRLNSGDNKGYEAWIDNSTGGIKVAFDDGTTTYRLNGLIAVDDNNWHHLAIVKSNNVAFLFVDGILEEFVFNAGLGNSFSNNLQLCFGAPSFLGSNFNGEMDELLVWDVAKTQKQIREQMHLSQSPIQSNLIHYWNFNNSDGYTCDDIVSGTLLSLRNTDNSNLAGSGAAISSGKSNTQTIMSAGSYDFSALGEETGVEITFSAGTLPMGEIVVTKLEGNPDFLPAGINTTTGNYWLIRNYGNNSSFAELQEIHFTDVGNVSNEDALSPSNLKLFKRASNANGNSWGSALAEGTFATAGSNGTISFGSGNGISSFSQLIIGTSGNSALPVELQYFDAEPLGEFEAALQWITESEKENAYFEVERSGDGNIFAIIGRVEGAGNSAVAHSYQFTDKQPLDGQNYYRLKMVDTEGKASYSAIRAVEIHGPNVFYNEGVAIFPLPFRGDLQVNIPSDFEETILIDLYDLKGRHLSRLYRGEIETGENNFTFDLSSYPARYYILEIEGKTQRHSHKILKIE